MALALKSLRINEKAGENDIYISIVARDTGIFSWILTKLRIKQATMLEVTKSKIRFELSSFSGHVLNSIPFNKLGSSYSGHYKPWYQLIWTIIIAFIVAFITCESGLIAGLIICLGGILGGLLVVFNTVTALRFVELNGTVHQVFFKRSFFERCGLSEQQGRKIAEIIQNLADSTNRKRYPNF